MFIKNTQLYVSSNGSVDEVIWRNIIYVLAIAHSMDKIERAYVVLSLYENDVYRLLSNKLLSANW